MNEKQIRETVDKLSGLLSLAEANDDRVNGENMAAAKKAVFSLATDLIAQAFVDLHRIADAQEATMHKEQGRCVRLADDPSSQD